MNFLTNLDLSDNERETVTASLQGWCGATGADPESLSNAPSFPVCEPRKYR
jgi:hypothetical protein